MKQYKLIKEYPGSWKKGTIAIFEKNSDRVKICDYLSDITAMQIINYPEYWEEVIEKQPLLITNDGKELFEGDTVYGIYDGLDKIFCTILYKKIVEQKWKNGFFSSREAAENYLIETKPYLSLNDVISCYTDLMPPPLYNKFIENIKQLAKSKINV